MKTLLLGAAAALALTAASAAQDAPAGAYALDGNHASITFRISHFGTSMYTARFDDFDIDLTFDPEHPETSHVNATIDVNSLDVDFVGDKDFKAELVGTPVEGKPDGDQRFFRAPQFPTITFASTDVEVTGEDTGTVTGDLTMLGQTHPITLDVHYYGSRDGMGGGKVVGFSANASVTRADWGMDVYPGVLGDDVEVWIEAEFGSTGA